VRLPRRLADLVLDRWAGEVLVVGIGGPVGVGKSTIAEELAGELAGSGRSATVVSTDGFLLPNVELDRRGLTFRKGFPESYDLERLAEFVASARHGEGDLEVPVYSHATYDVEPHPSRAPRSEVIVLEGVNALQGPGPPGDLVDVGVYVHADVEVVRTWFIERFLALTAAAADDASSFYRQWAGLPAEQVREIAVMVWDGVNEPNLRAHIEPSRGRADVVVEKGPDHEVRRVVVA